MQEELQNEEREELVAGFDSKTPPKAFVNSNAKSVLAIVRGIDTKVAAQTTLYTVPAGKGLLSVEALVTVDIADTVTVLPTVSIGRTPTWDNIYAPVQLNAGMDEAGFYQTLDASSDLVKESLGAGDVIKIDVVTPSTATEHEISVVLFGVLLSA